MTKRPTDLDRILEIAAELDPRAVSAEISLMTGSRLKSQNLESSGSRSATHGLPLPDKVDRWCRARHDAYRKAIGAARKNLEQASFIQSQLLTRLCDDKGNPTEEAQSLAAEDVSPQADTCANCQRVVERTATDKLLGGRCRNCHVYLKKHLCERPRDLWAAA